MGVWQFLVKACVDRRDDLAFSRIDCENGHNFVDIEFLYCDSTDQDQDVRCNPEEPDTPIVIPDTDPIPIPIPIPDSNEPDTDEQDKDKDEKEIVDNGD